MIALVVVSYTMCLWLFGPQERYSLEGVCALRLPISLTLALLNSINAYKTQHTAPLTSTHLLSSQ